MELRTKPYQAAVRNYFAMLLPKLAKFQASNGGPIIAFQVLFCFKRD